MSDPIERPTRNTGGAHTASMSAAQSRACSSIGHGGGPSVVVAPTPRASYVVLRKPGSKAGVWNRRQFAPGWSPAASQTMSGPAPVCS